MLLKIFFLNILCAVCAEIVSYDNFSLYRIYAKSERDLKFLNGLEESSDLHLWKSANKIGDYVSIIASPTKKVQLEESFKNRNINYDIMLKNVQEAFEDPIIRRKRDLRNQLFWTNYQTMEDIYAWFQHLANTYRDIVSIIHAGKSYEGRNITGVKISRRSSRRAIFIEGGQVAADWLSPTVVTYIVDQLVKGDDPVLRQATEDYEWHIFPILNPDGHEFTQNSNRLWLKNRRPTSGSAVGTDLTKNWNSQWGVRGGSFNPSDSNYIGLGPFSEVETRSISRYIANMPAILSAHLSFRAFGQRLLIPSAHTTSHMYNYNETVLIGRRAMGSLAVRYNTQYMVGTSMEVHDGATGNMADWIKHQYNPPVVMTYHLRDTGNWGYILPVDQVLPTCEETYDSILAILREAKSMNVL
ncbi:unnamed protein product, partial [Brenthis ino]